MSHPQQPGQPTPNYPPQGYGQPSGGQPGFAQPQEPLNHAQALAQARAAKAHARALRPWYKKKRFILPLALIALFAIIGIASAGRNDAPTAGVPASSASTSQAGEPSEKASKKTTASKAPVPANAKIGDTVTAGDWQFKITKFRCGISSVGNQYLGKKPQGQFCFLNVSATNNGDDEGTLDENNQKLLDAAGKEYSSDSEASLYEDSDSMLFLKGVNPGNTAKGLIVFDIPKKAKPTQASLAGGLFGSGKSATIDLK